MNDAGENRLGSWTSFVGLAGALLLGVALVPGVRADDGGQPGRAVRLSSVDGQVQIAQGGQTIAEHAVANTPLFEGAQLTTGDDGRAEIQFEDGSTARIPPASSLTISVLRSGATELLLNSGMAYFEIQNGEQGSQIRVKFDGSEVSASGFTVLRLKLDKTPGELAVFAGNAHVEGSGGQADVHGGETLALDSYNASESIEPDSWDAWNSDRDQALTASETARTAATQGLPNSGNPAWGDLNSSGTWYDVPDQGNVWSPYEASNPDWDPYGTGYWMNQPGYGYMWVSGEPWGYMPYQCGAWNWYDTFGWGWAPGMCKPWWGSGGWFFTIGRYPRWYRPPIRPLRPRGPRPGEPRHVGSAPVITVNRHLPSGITVLPPREPNQPVQIGGVIAQPLRPLPTRITYNHTMPVSNRPLNGAPAPVATRPVYTPPPGSPRSGTTYAPPRPVGGSPGGGYRPAAPSAPRPSGGSHPAPSGGGASHPSSGASHPSGGGGGGGGSHPSGGGAHH